MLGSDVGAWRAFRDESFKKSEITLQSNYLKNKKFNKNNWKKPETNKNAKAPKNFSPCFSIFLQEQVAGKRTDLKKAILSEGHGNSCFEDRAFLLY